MDLPIHQIASRTLKTTGRAMLAALVFGVLCVSQSAAAPQVSEKGTDKADKKEEGFTLIKEGTRPLATVTFASADRFVGEARYIFDAAGTPEAFRIVEDFLKGTLNDLEGFNREKPFGVMAYLPVAFPPLPEFIAFVPVDSVEAATKLIEKAPVVIRKDDEEGRYEVIAPNRTFPVMMRDGYAFIPLGNDPSAEALERELPDPAQLVASQAQQFDVSVRLDIESIPAATRTLLMGVITSGISTTLQQRDGEPEGAYQIRRIEGERTLSALNQLINECQKITFGLDVVPEEQAVNLDMVFDAVAGTKLFEEIFNSSSRPSYFIPLLDDDAAVSVSMSSLLADRDRDAYIEMMNWVKMEVARLIDENNLGAPPDENSPIGIALDAVQKSLEEGHVDIFAQFYKDSSGKLAIVGAMRLTEGEAMAAGFLDALTRLKNVEEIKKAGELQIGEGEHQGITFHRLTFEDQPTEAVAVFGKQIGITVGIGSTAIWGALGGENSFATLQSVMDKLEEAQQTPTERITPPSFRVIVNVNQLVEMAMAADTAGRAARAEREADQTSPDSDGLGKEPAIVDSTPPVRTGPGGRGRPNPRSLNARRQRGGDDGGRIFRETLAEGDDRIEIDARPTESGMRMRIRLEEGFVKIFGRLLANGLMPQPEESEPTPDQPAEGIETVE
jgi:hypothetical protein